MLFIHKKESKLHIDTISPKWWLKKRKKWIKKKEKKKMNETKASTTEQENLKIKSAQQKQTDDN